jgi:hypothetical protein
MAGKNRSVTKEVPGGSPVLMEHYSYDAGGKLIREVKDGTSIL